jgi:hypothetical protein
MSDFITELRRELVDAAERERRRSAPRRALARSRRPLALAVASAAAIAAAVVGIAMLGRNAPEPVITAPRVVATIEIGGFPQGATLAAGSVWVTENDGRVLRLDPRTRRVIATIPAATSAYDAISASTEAVWIMGAVDRNAHLYRLIRIDPATDRVVARIGSFDWFGAILAAAPGAVWLQLDKQAPPPLRRVDPGTNRIEGAFGRRWLTAMAVHEDRLWTLSTDGVLEWRDSATGRLLGRRPGFAPRPPGGPWKHSMAADADGVWVATGQDGGITRVSSAGDVELGAEVGANGPLALAGGSLWITRNNGTDRDVQIARVDPDTGRVTGRLELGSRLPQQLLGVGDDLWAVLSDGTAIVVH